MFENRRASDSIKIINRRSETDGTGDIWRASFEPMRRFLERAFFQSDAHNHFTTAMPGRYGIQDLLWRIKSADPSRSTHLVSGERHEIAAQLAHVDRQVSHALCRIHECEGACGVRFLTQLGHRINCPQRI